MKKHKEQDLAFHQHKSIFPDCFVQIIFRLLFKMITFQLKATLIDLLKNYEGLFFFLLQLNNRFSAHEEISDQAVVFLGFFFFLQSCFHLMVEFGPTALEKGCIFGMVFDSRSERRHQNNYIIIP